jgi:hypothetical protein
MPLPPIVRRPVPRASLSVPGAGLRLAGRLWWVLHAACDEATASIPLQRVSDGVAQRWRRLTRHLDVAMVDCIAIVDNAPVSTCMQGVLKLPVRVALEIEPCSSQWRAFLRGAPTTYRPANASARVIASSSSCTIISEWGRGASPYWADSMSSLLNVAARGREV